MNKKNNKNTLRNLALVTQLGISSIVPIILGVLLGQFIDKKIGTNGVFSIILLVIGAATAINNIFRLGMPKDNKKDLNDDEKNKKDEDIE